MPFKYCPSDTCNGFWNFGSLSPTGIVLNSSITFFSPVKCDVSITRVMFLSATSGRANVSTFESTSALFLLAAIESKISCEQASVPSHCSPGHPFDSKHLIGMFLRTRSFWQQLKEKEIFC